MKILSSILILMLCLSARSQTNLDNISRIFDSKFMEWNTWKDDLHIIKQTPNKIIASKIFDPEKSEYDTVTYVFSYDTLLCYESRYIRPLNIDSLNQSYGEPTKVHGYYMWYSQDKRVYAMHIEGTQKVLIGFKAQQ